MAGELVHHSARVLEFDALLELLRGYASSPLGQERIAALAPSTGRDWIERQQELAGEIREFRRGGGRFDFAALIDIGLLVEKSRIAGAALETTEIRDVILVVDRAAEWREIALHPPANMRSDWHGVRALSDQIVDFTEFLPIGNSRRDPGRGPRGGMAGDCAPSSSEYEIRLAWGSGALGPDCGLHGVSAFFPKQDPARWNPGRQGFARIGAHSPRDRKTAALDSGIPARIFAAAGRGGHGAG